MRLRHRFKRISIVLVFVTPLLVDRIHAWQNIRVLRPMRQRVGGLRHRAVLVPAVPERRGPFPDERTSRVALEAAFTQIDNNRDGSITLRELREAGFDEELVLSRLDANRDGKLSRDEFVDQFLALSTSELRREALAVVGVVANHTADEFPDARTRRRILEAAFDQVDRNSDGVLQLKELRDAGFDAKLLLAQLDTNSDGMIQREEFVDRLLELSSNELVMSIWEVEDISEALRRNQLSPQGKSTVWGSRSVRRAVDAPLFETISLLSVLVTSLAYALCTLDGLSSDQRLWLTNLEDFISILFGIEYLLRWWGRQFSIRALIEPTSLVDLVSFAPSLLRQLLFDSHGFQYDDFTFFKLLRILRIQRYLKDITTFRRFESALGLFFPFEVTPYQLKVARVVTSIVTLLFIATGLIYKAEHVSNPMIPDLFTALYFGLTTLTTVGFGDIVPITAEGKLVVSLSILCGITIIPTQLSSLAEEFIASNRPNSLEMQTMAAPCHACGVYGQLANASFCYDCGVPLERRSARAKPRSGVLIGG